MTMISAADHIKQHCYVGGGYVGGCSGGVVMSRLDQEEGYGCCSSSEAVEAISPPPPPPPYNYCLLGSDLRVAGQMADQDQSRTHETTKTTTTTVHVNNNTNETGLGGVSAGSGSKDAKDDDHDHDDQGWLQLSIGGLTAAHNTRLEDDQSCTRGAGDAPSMIELDLLPAGSTSSSSQQQLRSIPSAPSMFHLPEFRPPPPLTTPYNTSLFLQHPTISSNFPPHQDIINWANLRPLPTNLLSASPFSPSTSASLLPPVGPYFARPIQLHAGIGVAAGPSIDFRVIDPPRRPHSGIWFMLQAAQNQAKEPFLPQISKSFLRIKDGGMTIRLVTKYLVNKLKLESESEVEIRCRGQQVPPFLTLQHVRDSIWNPCDVVTLLPDSSTTDHIMVLHYGRSA